MIPELLSDIRYRLRALFRRADVERELEEELRFHIEREADKQLCEGHSPEEAMRRARIAFGGVDVVKEASREGRGLSWLETMRQDLRYGLRSLGRSPAFSTGVILTLALGIGANAVMFGIVDRLLFRAPPLLRAPDEVNRVYLTWNDRERTPVEMTFEYTRYVDLAKFTRSFSEFAGFSNRPLPVGVGPDAREMEVATVSASLFDFFDAQPVIGRFFVAEEDTVPVGATVAVLGYGFWQARYGGRHDVLGQQLQVGTVSYTIIGVAPKDFIGIAEGAVPVVYIPITTYAGTYMNGKRIPNYYTGYNWGWMETLARRKPGVTAAQASADLSQAYERSWDIEASLSSSHTPVSVAHPRAIAGPVQLERGPRQTHLGRVARWVWGVSVIVLLIACANVANLLLARAIRRRREVALRLALGVSRRRLAGQLLTESLLLAGIGGGAGLLLAHGGGALLQSLFLPAYASHASLVDGRTLVLASFATLLSGLATGLAPVAQARRADLAEDLKAGARDSGIRRSRTRTGLLLLQATLSVVLLVGAGLFVRSLENVHGIRLGYDVDPVLYIYPETRGAKLDDEGHVALRQRLVEATRAIPGVESASLAMTLPLWDTWTADLFVAGIDSVSKLGEFTLQTGSPEFFATVGTRILRGRGFTAEDRKDAPRVMVVSDAMGAILWPGKDPIGQCVRVDADTMPCSTVVGISESIRQSSLTGEAGFNYYMPAAQFHPENGVVFARVRGQADDMKESVRRQLQQVMPGDGYVTVNSMTDIVGPQVRSWKLGATMFLVFGGLALFLAAIGLYSVIAYDVAQRSRELGIRIALGAGINDVVRLVTRDGVRFAVAGIVFGGVIAFAAGRWIGPLLYAVSPNDPLVYGVVAGVLLAVAAGASALPALRATRVDPSVTLRTE
jgi:putative ABC transport system permease protein